MLLYFKKPLTNGIMAIMAWYKKWNNFKCLGVEEVMVQELRLWELQSYVTYNFTEL